MAHGNPYHYPTPRCRLIRSLTLSAARSLFVLPVLLLVGAPSVSAQVWQAAPEIKSELRIMKLDQILIPALEEYDVDLWLVFDRDADDERVNTVWEETRHPLVDPVAEYIGSEEIYQPAAFLFTASGERIAIVSTEDLELIEPTGIYSKILTYRYTKQEGFEGIFPLIRQEVMRLDPSKIALNWSEYEPMADGLTVGMYRLLSNILGERYVERFVSAEDIVVSLLGRNTDQELAWLQESADITLMLMQEAMSIIRPGITTERDLFNYIRFRMEQLGVDPGWSEFRSPIVTVQGPTSGRIPGDEIAMPGRLVKINGGVRVNGYSVDLNMNAYILRPGETEAPPALQHMWDTAVRSTLAGTEAIRVGVRGSIPDSIAREVVVEEGYEPWGYEFGHSVGTWIHGIGPTLAPPWSHFGRKTEMRIQANDTYAVEPVVAGFVPEMDQVVRVHVQEMVVVRPDGPHFMVPPQTELMLIPTAPH